MEAVTDFVGRRKELSDALRLLQAGHSLLIRGKAGIGKTALQQELYRLHSQASVCLWMPDTNAKQALLELLSQLHHKLSLQVPEGLIPARYRARVHRSGLVQWPWIKRSLARCSTRELADMLLMSLQDQPVVLFVQSLALAPMQAALIDQLLQSTQMVATVSEANRRPHIQQMLWRFDRHLRLLPLTHADSLALIEQYLTDKPLRFESSQLRRQFIRIVEQEAAGMPEAIEGILNAAIADGEVKRRTLRSYRHEPSIRYLDMTPLLLIMIIGFMMMRYISRGVSEVEMYVMSGVASSLFWGILMLLRRLKA